MKVKDRQQSTILGIYLRNEVFFLAESVYFQECFVLGVRGSLWPAARRLVYAKSLFRLWSSQNKPISAIIIHVFNYTGCGPFETLFHETIVNTCQTDNTVLASPPCWTEGLALR